MSSSDSVAEQVRQLTVEIKKYFILQRNLFKLEGVEKLSILLSTLLLVMLIVILGTGALFYIFFALAYALESLVGSICLSFCIIGGLYIILIVMIILLRKILIVNPLVRFLSSLFLKD